MENINNVVENVEVEGGATETENNVVEAKTFTQEELNKIVQTEKAKIKKQVEAERQKAYDAKLKAELEESEKLAKMNEADRLKAQAEKERKQFEADRKAHMEERKAFEQEKIKTQTMTMLGERNIPVELAKFVASESADEIMENVTLFQKHFNDAVEKVVTERMKGRTPKANTSTQSFDMNSLRNMSVDEINQHWDKIKNNIK